MCFANYLITLRCLAAASVAIFTVPAHADPGPASVPTTKSSVSALRSASLERSKASYKECSAAASRVRGQSYSEILHSCVSTTCADPRSTECISSCTNAASTKQGSEREAAQQACETANQRRTDDIERVVGTLTQLSTLMFVATYLDSADEASVRALPGQVRAVTEALWAMSDDDRRLTGLPSAPPAADRAATAAKVEADVRAAVDEEMRCRTSAACMSVRTKKRAEAEFVTTTVQPLCSLDSRIKDERSRMEKERSNPSGYVDKVLLHNLGSDIQDSQEQMRPYLAEFRAFRHRAFASSMDCTPAVTAP